MCIAFFTPPPPTKPRQSEDLEEDRPRDRLTAQCQCKLAFLWKGRWSTAGDQSELTCTDPRRRFSQEIQNQCFPGSTGKLLNLLDPSWLCRILPIIKAVPFSHNSDLIHSLTFFSYLALLAFPDLRKKFSLEWRAEEPQKICKASDQ